MPKTTYTVDADLNKQAPAQDTRVEFTTYYGKPRMLMNIGNHIIEINITKEIVQHLLDITGENIMPNWTNNTIIGKKSVLQKYVDNDEEVLDFNKIIPMPSSLSVESGSNSYDALIALAVEKPDEYDTINKAWKTLNMFNKPLKQEDRYKEAIANPDYKNGDKYAENCAFGQVLLDNYKSYGSCDWYDWRINHWGTKWNASSCYVDSYNDDLLIIRFDTAWSPPLPIFNKLTQIYPKESFLFEWQNEDGFETHYFIKSDTDDILEIDEQYDPEDPDSYEVINYEEIDNFRDTLLHELGLA